VSRKDSLSREAAFFDVEEREKVPMRHEKLLRKVRRGWKPLLQIPGLFSWFQGVPKGREKLLRKVPMGFAAA
jgi:hypothetical protein